MNSGPKLKIAFISPEVVPFAKTGGLADVSGALPKALAALGHDVRVFMPAYAVNNYPGDIPRPLDYNLTAGIGSKVFNGEILYLPDDPSGVRHYFIANDFFFGREQLYLDPATKGDYTDNDDRFIFFSKAVLESFRKLEWKPDLIHANDWQSALVVSLKATFYRGDRFYDDIAAVFTIHNMGFQGKFPSLTFNKLGLDPEHFRVAGPFEFWGEINFMKSAVYLADHITTVSPTYAREIQQTDEFGKGLQDVLAERKDCLTGILNGVDYEVWSPQKDKLIPHRYIPANLSGKKKNKLALLHHCQLPLRVEQPLIGMISRLDRQKGFDLLEEVAEQVMVLDLQMVVLGTGDERYHRFLENLVQQYPDRISVFLAYDNYLAHLIEAGADIFLMPSHYEPCGLNQMYSLKYATIPIVRKTGGLADTVVDFDEATGIGTGFVFEKYDSGEMLAAIKRAVRLYGRRRSWYKLMKQAMSQDFSWTQSAREYERLFRQVISRRKAG